MTLRKRLYLTLNPAAGEKGGIAERVFEAFLITVILLNILTIVLDSVASVHRGYHALFMQFENFSLIFFTIEYFARLYSIVEDEKYADPVKGRLKYLFNPLALVDLLAILPFYLTFFPIDLRFLRIFRLMALFRLFKIARYLHALDIFRRVLRDRKEQLVLSFYFRFVRTGVYIVCYVLCRARGSTGQVQQYSGYDVVGYRNTYNGWVRRHRSRNVVG